MPAARSTNALHWLQSSPSASMPAPRVQAGAHLGIKVPLFRDQPVVVLGHAGQARHVQLRGREGGRVRIAAHAGGE